MKQAVIFDMDGLMLDTTLTRQEAERAFLKDFGKTYDRAIATTYQGMRVRDVVATMIAAYQLPLSPSEGERILTQNIVANYAHPALELFPGCKRLVEDLQQSHICTLALASSSPKAAIEAMLKRFELTTAFAVYVSGEEVEHGKPAPDIFLLCVERLHIPPRRFLVLEDAPNGIRAAKKAGMRTIAVSNKMFYTPQDFQGSADVIVSSLEALSPNTIEAEFTRSGKEGPSADSSSQET
jgi:HAD superfamily hydrolase (TIGR01509 family)